MPSSYIKSSNGQTAAIPAGKTIKFYTSDGVPSTDDSSYNAAIFNTGTTSSDGSILTFAIPADLVNQSKYVIAVVILDADFDLQGKTRAQARTAVSSGQVLLGVTTNIVTKIEESVELTDGIVIENIIFTGM